MELLKIIQERQSARVPFDSKHQIEEHDLLKILEAGRWSPSAHNMQNFEIIVVNDPKLLDSIANIKRHISQSFIRENYQQLSFSKEELLRKKTGLPGTMFPAEWRDPNFNINSIDEKADSSGQRPFPSCPLMIIVVYDPAKRAPASEGDFLGILSLGCLMENMWLMANSLGIDFHIVSSLSSDNSEKEVKKILKIPENIKIAFCTRLGYASLKPEYLRVRREIDDFTSYNEFGHRGPE
jgi:nitroreductase